MELLVLKLHLQVAASHLDTVLEKLKNILDNAGQSALSRYLYDLFGRTLSYLAYHSANHVVTATPKLNWNYDYVPRTSHVRP